MAAMAAVSARRMRGPRVTGCHWCWVKRDISSGVQPPSGPMARAWVIRLGGFWLTVGVFEGGGQGGGLFGFAEEDAGGGGFSDRGRS